MREPGKGAQETKSTRKSEIWIKPRPGSDPALALEMIQVMINENLYDKAFVHLWTVGFDRLKIHIQDYPPEKVSEITWVPAEMIRKAARFFAGKKPNALETRKAMESLDFSVVSDSFMTPTAEMADIVLPVATHLEVDHRHESQNVPGLGVI